MTFSLWMSAALAATVSLIAPIALRPLLQHFRVMDIPTHRSSHSQPTLRGGGVAPMLGLAAGGIFATIGMPHASAIPTLLCTGTAIAAGSIGIIEDVHGIAVKSRLLLQALVGILMATLAAFQTGASMWWLLPATLFLTANINFTNFMDGINGISALHGFASGIAFLVLGVISEQAWLIAAGGILAAAYTAFLPWNLAPPGLFLGDSGSYLLGGATASLAITAIFAGLNPLAALAPLAIYWTDALTTLLRRALRKEPLATAHRAHTYQRLTNGAHTHVSIALLVAALTILTSGLGLLVVAGRINEATGLILGGLTCAMYVALPKVSRKVTDSPRRSTPSQQPHSQAERG